MVCNCLEKTFGNYRQGNIQYKLMDKQKVYVTYNQLLYPEVLISAGLKLSIEDYQWLLEIVLWQGDLEKLHFLITNKNIKNVWKLSRCVLTSRCSPSLVITVVVACRAVVFCGGISSFQCFWLVDKQLCCRTAVCRKPDFVMDLLMAVSIYV